MLKKELLINENGSWTILNIGNLVDSVTIGVFESSKQTGTQLFLCTMFIFGIKNIWIEFWYLFTAADSVAAEAKTKELPEFVP